MLDREIEYQAIEKQWKFEQDNEFGKKKFLWS
jgi:hypothetical protein